MLLSVIPPLLLEVCHRTGGRVEVVATFKLLVYNDLDAITMPPHFPYATGMDVIFKRRALDHVKALHARAASMSQAFVALAQGHQAGGSDSEEPWEESEPPPPTWTRRRKHITRSPSASGLGSDSASDAAEEEGLDARDERKRLSHFQAFPRSSHHPTTP